MAYFLKSVNFTDPKSIQESDITEFVKFCKNVYEFYDIYQTDCYSSNQKLCSDIQDNINKVKSLLLKLPDCPKLQEYIEIFDQKYKNLDLAGEIYTKKIRILQEDEGEEHKCLIETISQHQTLIYHPEDGPEPIWVSSLAFPNHGGDEESFYLCHGLDAWINPKSSERAYFMKKMNLVIKYKNNCFPITIARTAHA